MVFGAIGGFLLLHFVACLLYPGGTWITPESLGYSFWHNYLCDVLARQAVNGATNPGYIFGIASFLAFLPGLWTFWGVLAGRLGREKPRIAKAIKALGRMSTVGILVVMLTPVDEFPEVHSIHSYLSLLTATLGMGAAVLLLSSWWQSQAISAAYRRFTCLCFIPIVVNFVAYFAFHTELFGNRLVLPAMQKVSFIFLCFIMARAVVEKQQS